MFSKDLEYSIGQCYKRAREARHEYMTVEHLALALLDNPSAEAVLKACGADFNRLRGDLEQAIATSVSVLPDDLDRDTQPTLGFQRVLQRAVFLGTGDDVGQLAAALLEVEQQLEVAIGVDLEAIAQRLELRTHQRVGLRRLGLLILSDGGSGQGEGQKNRKQQGGGSHGNPGAGGDRILTPGPGNRPRVRLGTKAS